MPPRSVVPTRPLGQPGGLAPAWSVVAGQGWEGRGWETNPDLVFPQSVRMYDLMRRTESQLVSIGRAITLPIRRAKWTLNTDGVDPAIAAFVADELNLDGGVHQTGGINWPEHVREALLALWWGFAPFEVLYEIGPGRTPGSPDTAAHLAALALRPPITLAEAPRATAIGDFAGIVQMPPGHDTPFGATVGGWRGPASGSPIDVWIPASRLVMYCHEREGADWTGTSLLRGVFREWFLKDQSLRAAAQGVERNSMGLPKVTYTDAGQRDEALEIATSARAGEAAGVALPADMTMELMGVTGSLRDPAPLLKLFDEAMAAAVLAHFLTLGHDAGARSLGDTFADFFAMSLDTEAGWIGVTATSQVVRPLVDVNFGPGHRIPVIECEDITPGSSATAEAIQMLVDSGVITPDDDLEAQQRRSRGLPEASKATARPKVAPAPAAPGENPANSNQPNVTPPGDAVAAMDRIAAMAERVAQLAAAHR